MRVLVHGGAGSDPDAPLEREETLREAAQEGADAETPLDAVETAVRTLETDGRFNAGFGSALQVDGVPRVDAGVMTSERRVGAVLSVEGLPHAVSAARIVLEETPHIALAGEAVADLAAAFGLDTDADLTTEETRERYEDAEPPDGPPSEQLSWVRERFGGRDTVGAVARDGERFAAATSTGGRWFALAGRVGDVPQVGCGFYCGAAGAASATGAGEAIARTTLARRAVGHLEAGMDAQTAAETAIAEFGELTGESAGLIVLGRESAGSSHNAEHMGTGRAE